MRINLLTNAKYALKALVKALDKDDEHPSLKTICVDNGHIVACNGTVMTITENFLDADDGLYVPLVNGNGASIEPAQQGLHYPDWEKVVTYSLDHAKTTSSVVDVRELQRLLANMSGYVKIEFNPDIPDKAIAIYGQYETGKGEDAVKVLHLIMPANKRSFNNNNWFTPKTKED